MNLIIVNESSQRVPRKFLEKWCQGIELELIRRKVVSKKIKSLELTLVFLNRPAAQKLNRQYRSRNYATDVLSFASVSEDSLGDLVMCPEVLKKQSREHHLSYQQELGYMVLHGVLHLLGFDHEQVEREAKKMFGLQDAIFEVLLQK